MRYFPAGEHLTPGPISMHARPASGWAPRTQNRSIIASIKRSTTSKPALTAQYANIPSRSRSASRNTRYRVISAAAVFASGLYGCAQCTALDLFHRCKNVRSDRIDFPVCQGCHQIFGGWSGQTEPAGFFILHAPQGIPHDFACIVVSSALDLFPDITGELVGNGNIHLVHTWTESNMSIFDIDLK